MYELTRTIPDAQVLLAMEPEELGAKILFLLRRRGDNVIRSQQSFLFSNLIGELWPQNRLPGQESAYPGNAQRNQSRIGGGLGLARSARIACAGSRIIWWC